MKSKNSLSDSNIRHTFLQKFTGKINIISKHGQITDQKGFKLPLINTLNSKRSITINYKSLTKPTFTSSSESNRQQPPKSGTMILRAQKQLNHNKDKQLREKQRVFLKRKRIQMHKKQNHSQSISEMQTGITLNCNLPTQRPQQMLVERALLNQQKYSEYGKLGAESEAVKKTSRNKRYFI